MNFGRIDSRHNYAAFLWSFLKQFKITSFEIPKNFLASQIIDYLASEFEHNKFYSNLQNGPVFEMEPFVTLKQSIATCGKWRISDNEAFVFVVMKMIFYLKHIIKSFLRSYLRPTLLQPSI